MAKNNFSGSSTQPFVTNVQPVTTSLSNLGFGGINTDDSDDRINSSVMRLMENTDITKNGVIRPRRGYKWVSTLVEDYNEEDSFKLIGIEENQKTNNGVIFYDTYYALNNKPYINNQLVDLTKIKNQVIAPYGITSGDLSNWDSFHYEDITGKVNDFTFRTNQYFIYGGFLYSFLTSSDNFLLKIDKNKNVSFLHQSVPNIQELNVLGFNSLIKSSMSYDTNFFNCQLKNKLLGFSKILKNTKNLDSVTDGYLDIGINDIVVSPKSPLTIEQNIIGKDYITIPENITINFDRKKNITYANNCLKYIKGNKYIKGTAEQGIRVFLNNTSKTGVSKPPNEGINDDMIKPWQNFPIFEKKEENVRFQLPVFNTVNTEITNGDIKTNENKLEYENYYFYGGGLNRRSVFHNVPGYNFKIENYNQLQVLNSFSKTFNVNVFKSPGDTPSTGYVNDSNIKQTQNEIDLIFNPIFYNEPYISDNYGIPIDDSGKIMFNLNSDNNIPNIINQKNNWDLKREFPTQYTDNMKILNQKIEEIKIKPGYNSKYGIKIKLNPNLNFTIRNGQYVSFYEDSYNTLEWYYTWYVRKCSFNIEFEYQIDTKTALQNNSFILLSAITSLIDYKTSKPLLLKDMDTENEGEDVPTIKFYYYPWDINKNVWEEDLWLVDKSNSVPVPDPSKDGNIDNWLKPKFPDFKQGWNEILSIRQNEKNYTSRLFFTTVKQLLVAAEIKWPSSSDEKKYTSLFWKQIDLTNLNLLQTGRWITDTEIKSCQNYMKEMDNYLLIKVKLIIVFIIVMLIILVIFQMTNTLIWRKWTQQIKFKILFHLKIQQLSLLNLVFIFEKVLMLHLEVLNY